jgi:hypothetical protein
MLQRWCCSGDPWACRQRVLAEPAGLLYVHRRSHPAVRQFSLPHVLYQRHTFLLSLQAVLTILLAAVSVAYLTLS